MKSALKSENWLIGRTRTEILFVRRREARSSICSGVASVSRTSGIGASGVQDLSFTGDDGEGSTTSKASLETLAMPADFSPYALTPGVVIAWQTYSTDDEWVGWEDGLHGGGDAGILVQVVKLSSDGQDGGLNSA